MLIWRQHYWSVIVVFCGRNGKFAAAKIAIFRNLPQILLFSWKILYFTIFIIHVVFKSDKSSENQDRPFPSLSHNSSKAPCLLYWKLPSLFLNCY